MHVVTCENACSYMSENNSKALVGILFTWATNKAASLPDRESTIKITFENVK